MEVPKSIETWRSMLTGKGRGWYIFGPLLLLRLMGVSAPSLHTESTDSVKRYCKDIIIMFSIFSCLNICRALHSCEHHI